VTAVASTQKEVTANIEKSLEMNTEVTNSMQNLVEKPTELDLFEISYPTDDKISSVEKSSVDLSANSLKENVCCRRVECRRECRCRILECCRKDCGGSY